MEKAIWRKDGMKQIINTGHKTFDRQFVCASTGNVIGGGQYSTYIRAFTETECNGHVNQPGYLQDWDLQHFHDMPAWLKREVKELCYDESLILYEFYHYDYASSRNITHGYVLTTGYPEYKLIKQWTTGPTYKSYEVINTLIKYITN